MAESFIEVGYDAVRAAARQTAGLSPEWQTWAGECDAWLRNGAAAVGDGFVTSAAEGYVGEWNERLFGVSAHVQALGMNTGSGANLVASADAESTGQLNVVGLHVDWSGGTLSRSIGV